MKIIALEELCPPSRGSVNPAKFEDETFELFSIPAFDAGQPEIVKGSEIGSSKQIVENGDILLSKIVPHIRRAWEVEATTEHRTIASSEWIVFKHNDLFPGYLRHVLVGDIFHNQFMQTVSGVGGSLLRARPAQVKLIKIPLPPLAEQERIASILDKADAIRRKRKQALDLTDTFLRSTFLEMFGDPVTNGWEMTTVEHVALQEKGSMRTGPFGSQLLTSEFVDSGITVLGIDNAVSNKFTQGKARFITEEKYENLKKYTVKSQDVLITIMGTCGRCAIVPDNHPPAINTKHLCCITLNHSICLPEFLHSYFLMHPKALSYLGQTAKGAIMNGLNMGIIKNLPIPLPPIELQLKYSKIVKQLNQTNGSIEKNAETAENLFSSLQQKAFKGEL